MTQLIGAEVRSISTLEARCRRWLANLPRGQFWTFFTAAIFFNFGFAAYFFLFNLYLLDFGFTERFLGLVGGLMATGTIIGTIPAGVAAQRFGLRATLTGCVLLTVCVSILRTLIVWQPAQLVLAVCCGLVLCCWAVCLSPSVAGLATEQQRPIAFSLIFASGIGIAGLGALFAGRLPEWIRSLSSGLSITSTKATGAALLISCGIALLALIPISRLTLRAASSGPQLPRFTNPFLRRFLPAMAIWGLVTGSFAPFANVFFVHHLGFSMARAGAVFSFANLGQFIAVICAPLLFRRVGLAPGIMTTQLTVAAALVLLSASHAETQVAVIYWIYMSAQSMNEPGIYNLLMDQIPAAEHNGASAAAFFVSGIAQAVASLATGAAIVRFGYSVALIAAALLAAMAAILFGRLPDGQCFATEHRL